MASAKGIFDRHHLSVFRFFRRLSGDASLAEDLTQEVFLRVIRNIRRYREEGREKAWVFRIARNLWLNHLRDAKPTVAKAENPLPARVSAKQVLSTSLDQAISRLSAADRECFLLREIGGFGYREIADLTGITPDGVRSRIHRARCALRKALTAPGLME